ncbi:MAG TPA: hypothetical protein VMC80_03445, partial [Patescibacteria group bacterium]|nr:hypothetical protein [Patescibacteria group bacterium]
DVPSNTLDVRGTGNFSGPIYINNGTLISSSGGTNYWGSNGSNIYNDTAYVGIGEGMTTPERALQVVGNQSGGIVEFKRITSSTTAVQGTLRLKAQTTGQMADGFGTGLYSYAQDADGVEYTQGGISWQRDGLDNKSDAVIYGTMTGTGSLYEVFRGGLFNESSGTPLGSPTVSIGSSTVGNATLFVQGNPLGTSSNRVAYFTGGNVQIGAGAGASSTLTVWGNLSINNSFSADYKGNTNMSGNLTVNGNYISNGTSWFSFADLNNTGTSSSGISSYTNIALTNQSDAFANSNISGIYNLSVNANLSVNSYIGIGTGTPSNTLDVRGTGNFSGNIYLNNASAVPISGNCTQGNVIQNITQGGVQCVAVGGSTGISSYTNIALTNQSNSFTGNATFSGNVSVLLNFTVGGYTNVSNFTATNNIWFSWGGAIIRLFDFLTGLQANDTSINTSLGNNIANVSVINANVSIINANLSNNVANVTRLRSDLVTVNSTVGVQRLINNTNINFATLGVATTSPTQKLEVQGNVNISNNGNLTINGLFIKNYTAVTGGLTGAMCATATNGWVAMNSSGKICLCNATCWVRLSGGPCGSC